MSTGSMGLPPGRGVLCSGNIVYDTLACVDAEPRWGACSFAEKIEYHAGGNGANTSIVLGTIGIPVRILGAVGRDAQGEFVLDALCRAGVDVGVIDRVDAPTAATVVIVNGAGDRKFLHRTGCSDLLFPEPINFSAAITAGMSHYHLASIFTLPQLRRHAGVTLERARAAGLVTSLDTNWDPSGRWMEDLASCLQHLDYIFMNEDEALMTTGCSGAADAASRLLQRGVGTAVMKLGARGCAIYTAREEVICPAFDVEVKDTTGAGDCFVAGFLAAVLQEAPLGEAGRFANAVAALSVQRVGGVSGVPPYAAIETWMRSAALKT